MKIDAGETYHIYNQGNNREKVFYTAADYLRFLTLYKKLVYPYCDTLAYCLMPNHFHFLLHCTDVSVLPVLVGKTVLTRLTNGFRLLQSGYTQYLNPQQQRTGSLFRQRVHIKSMAEGGNDYLQTAFHYIHQNPVAAGLVPTPEAWPYSSFRDFTASPANSLCNMPLAFQLLGFDKSAFAVKSAAALDETMVRKTW